VAAPVKRLHLIREVEPLFSFPVDQHEMLKRWAVLRTASTRSARRTPAHYRLSASRFPASRAVSRNGVPYETGDTLKQPDPQCIGSSPS
jgi:hypothetical protein